MFDDKKWPQTFRYNSKWYMYNSKTDRNPHRSTVVTPEAINSQLKAMEASEIYKEYSDRANKDYQSAYNADENTNRHELNFHRTLLAASASNTFTFATLLGGLLFGALANFPSTDKEGKTNLNYAAFGLACIGLFILIAKLILDCTNHYASDNKVRKKQHFINMEGLRERLPLIAQEIKEKEQVITALTKFFIKYNSSTNPYRLRATNQNVGSSSATFFNMSERGEEFENLALALDRKDDLAAYKKVFNALAELKNQARLREDTEFSKTLRLLLYGYLKKDFYNDHKAYFDAFALPESVQSLINEASERLTRLTEPASNPDAHYLPEIDDIPVNSPSQEEQAAIKNKIYDYFTYIMEDSYKLMAAQQLVKLAEVQRWNELEVIAVFAKLKPKYSDYKTLATNMEQLVNSNPGCLARLLRQMSGNANSRFDNLKERGQAKLFRKLLKVLFKDKVVDKFAREQAREQDLLSGSLVSGL